jgi:hypothetical protein
MDRHGVEIQAHPLREGGGGKEEEEGEEVEE